MNENLPEIFQLNYEEIKKLLLKNKTGLFMPTPINSVSECGSSKKQLIKYLNEKSEEFKFSLPEEPFFKLFYVLGTGDFDAFYLYSYNWKHYLVNSNPTIKNIINVSEGISRLTEIPLLSISQEDRFALPKFQLYENGIVARQSCNAGREEYSDDYWMKDEEELEKRGERIAKALQDVMLEGFNPKSLEGKF